MDPLSICVGSVGVVVVVFLIIATNWLAKSFSAWMKNVRYEQIKTMAKEQGVLETVEVIKYQDREVPVVDARFVVGLANAGVQPYLGIDTQNVECVMFNVNDLKYFVDRYGSLYASLDGRQWTLAGDKDAMVSFITRLSSMQLGDGKRAKSDDGDVHQLRAQIKQMRNEMNSLRASKKKGNDDLSTYGKRDNERRRPTVADEDDDDNTISVKVAKQWVNNSKSFKVRPANKLPEGFSWDFDDQDNAWYVIRE
jgi:hypothetical protein